MKVLKVKGAKSARRFSVKLPVELADRVDALDAEVKEKGFIVDWSAVCAEALEKLAAAVEADLKEAESA